MGTLHARGIDFHYETWGDDGPPLLVAHGLLSSVAFAPMFGERYDLVAAKGVRVFAYDARGHGRSGGTPRREEYGWHELAEDMHAVIRALGFEKMHVMGGSMGAATAILCAAAHPDVIERLVLVAPPPLHPDAMARVGRRFAWLARLYRVFGPRMTANLVMLTPQARREQRESPTLDPRAFIGTQRRALIVPAIRALVSSAPDAPLDRLGEIANPALVLAHRGDPVHPLASAELLHDRMPHARLAVVPSATYWQKHPEVMARIVGSFVRGEALDLGLPERCAERATAV